jgi:hypothetical protein
MGNLNGVLGLDIPQYFIMARVCHGHAVRLMTSHFALSHPDRLVVVFTACNYYSVARSHYYASPP